MPEDKENSMNNESSESGALFVTIVISLILIVLAGGLAYNLGQANPFEPTPQGSTFALKPTELAQKTHLDGATVSALTNLNNGYVKVTIHPDSEFIFPQGATIEGFLVDAGTVGDFGTSSETVLDEFYGVTLSNGDADGHYDQIPYALSIGRVKQDPKTKDYTIELNVQNTLIPYDRVVLTLESDADRLDYDPRPSAIIYSADIPSNLKSQKALREANEISNPAK